MPAYGLSGSADSGAAPPALGNLGSRHFRPRDASAAIGRPAPPPPTTPASLISRSRASSRAPGLRTQWEIHFAPGRDAGETEVREVMKAPLGWLGRAALALMGKFPAEEVTSNLHRLKEVVETGRVTDTSYSVPGKFKRVDQHELKNLKQ